MRWGRRMGFSLSPHMVLFYSIPAASLSSCLSFMLSFSSRFLNLGRTVRFDPVNRELLPISVLLTLRTSIWEKCMKPFKPRSDRMVLRTVANFWGSHGSFIWTENWYWPACKCFEFKKFEREKKKKKEPCYHRHWKLRFFDAAKQGWELESSNWDKEFELR